MITEFNLSSSAGTMLASPCTPIVVSPKLRQPVPGHDMPLGLNHGSRTPSFSAAFNSAIEGESGQKCCYVYSAEDHRPRGCSRNAWESSKHGFCVYHSAANATDPDIARGIWETARHLTENRNGDFTGWHFPDDPDRRWFRGLAFSRSTVFIGATFEGFTSFEGVTFESDVFFTDAVFRGYTDFSGATVKGHAYFARATFSDVTFDRFHVSGHLLFPEVRFGGQVTVENLEIGDGCELFLDLPEAEVPFVPGYPFRKRDQGESLYRLASKAARFRGEKKLARKYAFGAVCAREHGRREWYTPRLFRIWFHPSWFLGLGVALFRYFVWRLAFAFGRRPIRVAVSCLILMVVCGGFLAGNGTATLFGGDHAPSAAQIRNTLVCQGVSRQVDGHGVALINGKSVVVNSSFEVAIEGRQVTLKLERISSNPYKVYLSHKKRTFHIPYNPQNVTTMKMLLEAGLSRGSARISSF